MDTAKIGLLKKAQSFDDILEIKYGKRGMPDREDFHERVRDFTIRELREEICKVPDAAEELFV